jgi:hypothetical protein
MDYATFTRTTAGRAGLPEETAEPPRDEAEGFGVDEARTGGAR